ncbi:uncharacterized protein LOC111112259 isoform X2 [Crassostrea virginica]
MKYHCKKPFHMNFKFIYSEEMPRRETTRRVEPITQHTLDHSLVELDISQVDREVYEETTPEFIELFLILPKAVWPRLGEPRRPEGLVINTENWGDFIDKIIEDSAKEVLYGPEFLHPELQTNLPSSPYRPLLLTLPALLSSQRKKKGVFSEEC